MRLSHLVAVMAATALAISPAAADVSATGSFGERISISKSSVKNSQVVTVKGTGFDETVGLYLAYCVLPKKGQAPTPCGGGANMKGIGDASFWISSNAPPYAKGLVIPFKPGGRFTQKVSVSKRIGKFDCTKVKCAITVRSDHLREGDRTRDLFIPITFTKK